MTSKKTIPVREGDILAIQIEDNKYAAGLVLHVSKYFKGSILVGYFNRCFVSTEAIILEELDPEFAFTPNYTGKPVEGGNDWTVIGNRVDLIEDSIIPKLVVVTDIFYKDEVVERLPSLDAAQKYETLKGQGRYFVENKLRNFFETSDCK